MEIWTYEDDGKKVEPFSPFPDPQGRSLSDVILAYRRKKPDGLYCIVFTKQEEALLLQKVREFVPSKEESPIAPFLERALCRPIKVALWQRNSAIPTVRYTKIDPRGRYLEDNIQLAIRFDYEWVGRSED